jgi:glycolate oxidase FAD binding subunit
VTEVTFKVLPSPETEVTLVLHGLDDVSAIEALSVALGSPFEVTGAAHRPAQGADKAETWIRVEGFATSVTYRLDRLRQELTKFGAADDELTATESRAMWSDIRDLKALGASPDAVVWRVSVRPSDGPAIAEAARRAGASRILMDWGGGLLWIACTQSADAGAAAIRSAVKSVGGHATLVRASEEMRRTIPVFEPPAAPLMDLTRRLKQSFDPAGILNPGRMYGDV